MSAVAGDEHHDALANGTSQVAESTLHEPPTQIDALVKDLDTPVQGDDVPPPPEPATTDVFSKPTTATEAADTPEEENTRPSTEEFVPQVSWIPFAAPSRADEHVVRTRPRIQPTMNPRTKTLFTKMSHPSPSPLLSAMMRTMQQLPHLPNRRKKPHV